MKSKRMRVLMTLFLLMIVSMIPMLASAAGVGSEGGVFGAVEDSGTAEAPEIVEVEYSEEDSSINFFGALKNIALSTGIARGNWRQYLMLVVACVLLYLAIVKQFEPLLLLPIAFGMLLANLPAAGMMADPTYKYFSSLDEAVKYMTSQGKSLDNIVFAYSKELGGMAYQVPYANGGLLWYLYRGVKLGIYPPLIFMGVGAMTDFGPLLANPKSLLLGAAAQLGIFLAFIVAMLTGAFSPEEAASIGIIGGADGPTAIFVTTRLAPQLLGPIAVAAYSYMALVPVIQPPIMKALTTKEERSIVMEQLRPVSKTELIIFPIVVTIVVSLLLPDAATLIGSAGVSAVPMAARVSNTVGQQENPGNFLLMHAMGPNVAGVIGSAVAAGVFIALYGAH